MTEPGPRLTPSQRLRRIMVAQRGKRTTFGQVVHGLGNRSIGVLLMLLAVPTFLSIPLVPMAAIMSVGIGLIAVQMLLGRSAISLPEKLTDRPLPDRAGRKFLFYSFRSFRWIEKFLSPRLAQFANAHMQPLLGGVIALLALIIFLPIPGGNMVPGISIFIIGAGLAIGDGVAVIVGLGAAVLALGVTAALITGLVMGSAHLFK